MLATYSLYLVLFLLALYIFKDLAKMFGLLILVVCCLYGIQLVFPGFVDAAFELIAMLFQIFA